MNLKPFVAWCAAQGIVSPLDVRVRENGARYMVLKEEEVDRISSSITPDSKVRLVECPMEACLTAPSAEGLVDRLLYERSLGEDSQWAPWLAILPQQVSDYHESMPRFWSPERLARVTDGGILREELQADRDRVEAVTDPWALAVVDSRCNILPDGSYALTPWLDLLNHDGAVPTTARIVHNDDDRTDTFVLEVAAESIPGTPKETAATATRTPSSLLGNLFQRRSPPPPSPPEVCISYGDLTNLQTLMNYGFVTDNPCNTERVDVHILRQPYPIRAEIQASGSVDSIALGALRRLLATEEELQQAQTSEQLERFALVPFLSHRNEVETHAVIVGFVEEALDEARRGAAAANAAQDALVGRYLSGRVRTLQTGLDRIRSKFPQVFGG